MSLIDQLERGVPCTEVKVVTQMATMCFFKEITEDATYMSATAAQYRYCAQLWLRTFEPSRNFILKDIPEIMTSTKRQKIRKKFLSETMKCADSQDNWPLRSLPMKERS